MLNFTHLGQQRAFHSRSLSEYGSDICWRFTQMRSSLSEPQCSTCSWQSWAIVLTQVMPVWESIRDYEPVPFPRLTSVILDHPSLWLINRGKSHSEKKSLTLSSHPPEMHQSVCWRAQTNTFDSKET